MKKKKNIKQFNVKTTPGGIDQVKAFAKKKGMTVGEAGGLVLMAGLEALTSGVKMVSVQLQVPETELNAFQRESQRRGASLHRSLEAALKNGMGLMMESDGLGVKERRVVPRNRSKRSEGIRGFSLAHILEFSGVSSVRTLNRLVKSGCVDAPVVYPPTSEEFYSLNALRQCVKASELKRQGFSYADQMRWLKLRKKRGGQKLKGLRDYLDTGDESKLTNFSKDEEREFEELNGQLELLQRDGGE